MSWRAGELGSWRDTDTADHKRRRALLCFVILSRLAVVCFVALSLACGPAPRRAALIVGVEQDPSSMDPRVGADVAADRVFRLLYRGLFAIGRDFSPEPDLVESWTQTSPTTYRFVLKTGVRFSDGRELTARDAAYTIESVRSGRVASFKKGDLDRIASVAARSPSELELTLREPFVPILSALNMGIVPEGHLPEDPPVGAGPYTLRSWDRGQWMVFGANPFADPPPASPTVALKVVPDPVVRELEMRRGSVDLVVNDLPPDSIRYFLSRGYPVLRAPGSSYAYIGLNCARPLLDLPGVRRALALAVDRDALLEYVLRGLGRRATGLLPPEHWAYDAAGGAVPHDPRAAEQLLEAAGLRKGADGVRLRLSYKTSENKISRQIAVAVAEDWARVGVEVSVRSLEWGTFYGDVRRGDFDAFGLTWVGVTDPDGFRLRFCSGAFPPDGLNRGRFKSAEVDRLVETAARTASREERKGLYGDVQVILAAETPYISLWWPDAVCVTQRDVTGVDLPPDGNFGFLAGVSRKPSG
jgi:peptide/nickel transport system substrate-binding protein